MGCPRLLCAQWASAALVAAAVAAVVAVAAADLWPSCSAFTGVCLNKGPRAVAATRRCCSPAFPTPCGGGGGGSGGGGGGGGGGDDIILDHPIQRTTTQGTTVSPADTGSLSVAVRPSTQDFCRRLCHDMAEFGHPYLGKGKICLLGCAEEWYSDQCWSQMGIATCKVTCRKAFWHKKSKRHACYRRCDAKCTYLW